MNTSASKMHIFSYKSAFLFFGFILVFNLIFNPLLAMAGVGQSLSLYLINTLAISTGLTLCIVFVEGKFKNKKHAFLLFLSLLIISAIVCFFIVYQ